MKKKKIISFIMMSVGLILILAAMGFVFYLSINSPFTMSDAEFIYIKGPHPEIARVSLQDAKNAYDNNAAVFLDVRPEDAFSVSHIPGAISIPESDIDIRLGELSQSDWIITYCS